MPQEFQYDAFFSYSSKDLAVVQEITQRLAAAGLRIWLDIEQIKPGDSIPAKIEEGLENSRVLVLCLSANAVGSEWTKLESNTFRFRDPLNKERRFIPLRLDDTPLRGSLAQFSCIDWRAANPEAEYSKLHEACRPPKTGISAEEQQAREEFLIKIHSLGHTASVRSVAWSPDGRQALSGASDNTVQIWELGSGRCLRILEGHTDSVRSVAWSPDGRQAISGSADKTVRVWEVGSGRCLRVLKGHIAIVRSVMWSPDGGQALSGADDKTVRVWEVDSGRCLRVIEGHTDIVWSVA